MSRSIQVVVAPEPTRVRVIATEGSTRTLLKAHLALGTSHPRALPYLLEALALWEGATVHAVLAVDEEDASSATTLYRDVFADAGSPPRYYLDWVPVARVRRRRRAPVDPQRLGDFRDLRRLVYPGGER